MSSLAQIPVKAETVSLNGSTIYYEIFGQGAPLFLLHGYTWSSKAWRSYLSDYTDDFEVYLVDLKGHGKSGVFTENISLRSAAGDIGALATYLGLDEIQAIGYSYGGELLFQLALLHPGLVRSMIVVGTCGSWNADDFPEFLDYLSYQNLENMPWVKAHQTTDEQIRAIFDQLPNYRVSVSNEEMKTIQTQTLFVVGDRDEATSYEGILEARKHLPNSYLWVVPNTGHPAHKDKNKEHFVRVSKEFFHGDWKTDE